MHESTYDLDHLVGEDRIMRDALRAAGIEITDTHPGGTGRVTFEIPTPDGDGIVLGGEPGDEDPDLIWWIARRHDEDIFLYEGISVRECVAAVVAAIGSTGYYPVADVEGAAVPDDRPAGRIMYTAWVSTAVSMPTADPGVSVTAHTERDGQVEDSGSEVARDDHGHEPTWGDDGTGHLDTAVADAALAGLGYQRVSEWESSAGQWAARCEPAE